ncbi:ABC transporter substrate-binding protein [Frankia sp. CiP3]|uniref:ABC transporter substrate-binding protein n=1 Tax=Frankia sp. CiP3 TaxID=2880971 RepID=UPI001EF73753|nr:ABC transporter substrate-binding protein [Frankia sp. CiP3]
MDRQRRTVQRIAVAVARATIALTVVACGASPISGHPEGQNCTVPGVTDKEVKIGFLYPATGPLADGFHAFRAGVDARLSAANADGGVNGRTLSYTWRDDASDPATNLVSARALINDDGVFGIIETTGAATGSAPFLHEQGIPVTGLALEPVWGADDNMFTHLSFASPGSITTWGDYAVSQGGRTAFILRTAFSETMRTIAENVSTSLRTAGVRIAGSADVSPSASPTSLGAQIKASGADTLIALTAPDALDQALIGARNAGVPLKVTLSFSPGYDQSLLQKYGRQLAGTSYFLEYTPFELDTPAHWEFLRAMNMYAPQLQPPVQGGALSGWISADMMIRGLQEAGICPTRQQFIHGLRAVRDYNANGLLPAPLDMATNAGQLNTCLSFVKVSDDGTRFNPEPTARCGRKI